MPTRRVRMKKSNWQDNQDVIVSFRDLKVGLTKFKVHGYEFVLEPVFTDRSSGGDSRWDYLTRRVLDSQGQPLFKVVRFGKDTYWTASYMGVTRDATDAGVAAAQVLFNTI